jgi:pSer/pThr/pTyr-binding forkhead associated (FHA) protein
VKQITVLFSGRKQAQYLLDEPHVVIGRGRSAHIPLDGNPIVSRQHAVIRAELDSHILEDLGGANGTYLNDALVTQARLRPGDRIVLGKHTLRYEQGTEEARSLKGIARESDDPEDNVSTRLVPSLADPEAPPAPRPIPKKPDAIQPPWAAPAPAARPMEISGMPGNERTVAASKEELEILLAQMKVKAAPHLSINRSGKIVLVPLTDPPVLVGYTDECSVRLKGSRWFGKVAAVFVKEGEAWWIHARSPFWNTVVVGSTRVRRKLKLSTGVTIAVADLKARFSLGEQS